ncbi:hypothetical protein HYS31_00530 [Candidatus Woesearchaeota archaeon]|nr:hypothetical protein [Candidatus Woesearchaeota archaeon]
MEKKAQMEILGLAIVVVLVLIATIFVVRFILLKTPVNYRQGFVSAELASNTLNTFLKTTAADCSLLTMTELLQDCAQSEELSCRGIESLNSCKYVNDTMKGILAQTLEKWSIKYEFLAYVESSRPLIRLSNPENPCPADKRSKIFPIPIKSGTMYVKLGIC